MTPPTTRTPDVERLLVGLVGAHRGEPDWRKLTLTYETSAQALRAHEALDDLTTPPTPEDPDLGDET